jgi:preprotein translocase subunit SecA
MSIINSILKGFVGNKADKDYKSALPIVEEVNHYTEELKQLSNDDLRARTAGLRAEIQQEIRAEQEEINSIKSAIEKDEIPMADREKSFSSSRPPGTKHQREN